MKRIGIIFGGRSGEHDISIMSGNAVLNALDREKYEPVPIGIDRDGGWHLVNPETKEFTRETIKTDSMPLNPGTGGLCFSGSPWKPGRGRNTSGTT